MTTHSNKYEKQVELLLDVMPHVSRHKEFAVKGGTAINLFHLNYPRHSVDIDLTYLPLKPRKESYSEINAKLKEIKSDIESNTPYKVNSSKGLTEGSINKLEVLFGKTIIKIEPNYILRGSLLEPKTVELCPKASEMYDSKLNITMLDPDELYAGKICASLDRQSPRDLFDMHTFFKKNTITQNLKDAFLYYLVAGNRPLDEMLNPNLKKGLEADYENLFVGMTKEEVKLSDLKKAFIRLKKEIVESFQKKDIDFLLSVSKNQPVWELYKHPEIKNYPAIQWKMLNINKMSVQKRYQQTQKLEELFSQDLSLSL